MLNHRKHQIAFISPAASTFSGLWEVKSGKYHLHRCIGSPTLTFKEFLTLIKQDEELLNSRKLCEAAEDMLDPPTPRTLKAQICQSWRDRFFY